MSVLAWIVFFAASSGARTIATIWSSSPVYTELSQMRLYNHHARGTKAARAYGP